GSSAAILGVAECALRVAAFYLDTVAIAIAAVAACPPTQRGGFLDHRRHLASLPIPVASSAYRSTCVMRVGPWPQPGDVPRLPRTAGSCPRPPGRCRRRSLRCTRGSRAREVSGF